MAYRHYVLGLLLLVYIHCLLSRMLPAFLVSVPTPGCELACFGMDAAPLCEREDGWEAAEGTDKDAFASCQRCRARVGDYAGGGPDGNWFNMRDGACVAHWEYGLLVGYGFALPFVMGSFATAEVVDHVDRRALLAAAIGAWSWSSGIMAGATCFWPLLASRCLLGAAEAAVVPAALSLVTEYFDRGSHGFAGSILASGVCLGAGAASWAVPLALRIGWRAACRWVGGCGLILAALVFATIREPEREYWRHKRPDAAHARRPAVVWTLAAAASLRLAASYAIAAFLPVYYMRMQLPGYSAAAYGGANAAIVSVTGLSSAIIGGMLADHFSERFASAPCLIAAVSQLAAAVLFSGVFSATTFAGSLTCYGAALLAGECWYGLTLVQLKTAVPPEAQGRTTSAVLCAATMVSNVSPSVVGVIDPGTAAIGGILQRLITSCTLLAAVLFFVAAWELDGELQLRGAEVGLLSVASTPTPTAVRDDSPLALPMRSVSVLCTVSEGLQKQVSKLNFFAAPGHTADIWVPDGALDRSPSPPVPGTFRSVSCGVLRL